MQNEQLKEALLKAGHFTAEQVEIFAGSFTGKTIPKNEYLLKPGKTCDFIAIVLKGGLRFLQFDGQNEHTLHFFTESDWLADFESFVAQQPSKNYIQALEDTEVAIITIYNVHELIRQHNDFLSFFRVMEQWSISTNKYISNMSLSPDDRYRQLLKEHPGWINRFPQMYIASWLGMTPETFSRVRNRIRIS